MSGPGTIVELVQSAMKRHSLIPSIGRSDVGSTLLPATRLPKTNVPSSAIADAQVSPFVRKLLADLQPFTSA